MAMLSKTGSMQEAYRAVYKVKDYGNPKLESSRVGALANQVLRRIREKDPQFAAEMTFEDITADYVKKGLIDLKNRAQQAGNMNVEARMWELMGKTQAIFTDKVVSDTKITEVTNAIYKETDEDFPEIDKRISREEMEIDRV